jgi:hypothetical protein
MLPNPDDCPSFPRQKLIDFPVTGNIRFDLLHPEILSGIRFLEMQRTAMPIAAVDENYNFFAEENDIRFSVNFEINPVSADAFRPKKFPENYLGSGIFPTDS